MLCQAQHKGDIERLSHGLLFLDLHSSVVQVSAWGGSASMQADPRASCKACWSQAVHLATQTGLVVLVSTKDLRWL